ncbi:ATP-binding cassette domain-containing protein [Bacillus cereus group sp. BC251]|jgi:excinuclease ABC A subunit|uniref:ATP-binding cassette domain-containing protein n=1 Tax=Bacillus cereus group TaxID=86661 RepID=UPI0012F980B7|nr:excinuclease ABC subunit UvrA [Bacillus cereus]HDR4597643.1 excinuclease ABC subunit UvrA [Bacillus cereus]HDR4655237.1 excinuclease ABC subunit UvrA [Bacillus cereus]
MLNAFENNFIEIINATENNLKNIHLKIPKKKTTVFVGLSGSGKSSLVFDTLAAVSRRELNETFPSFTQQYLPKYGQPHVENIKHLPVAIVVEQQPIGKSARSTLATYTGIYSLIRLMFSRIGKPFIGYSEHYSFNLPQGMCPTCQGLGYIDEIHEDLLIDKNKSLNEGAITFVSFGPGTWRWEGYANSGLFDLDKPLKDYTPEEFEMFMHAPRQKLENPPKEWGKTALYEGLVPRIKRSIIQSAEGRHHKAAIEAVVTKKNCPNCKGTRLNSKTLTSRINGYNIAEVCSMDLIHLVGFIQKITEPIAKGVTREILSKVNALIDIGLGYLSLNRGTDTLSGGEAQRIKIAKYLSSSLSDLVYIFDEPSVGLHPHDIILIKQALTKLKEQGNTVILVEHNPSIIEMADYIVEMGPKAGTYGGYITFTGSYQELLESDTITGRMLQQPIKFKKTRSFSKYIQVNHIESHNVHDVDVKIPVGIMTVISGPAGSGKSTLVNAVKRQVSPNLYIDLKQDSIGINIRSTPATYLNILSPIRKLFGKDNNVSIQLFSFNGKGACPKCKGKGVTITEMAFMDPVTQTCELCNGKRYSKEALQYKYQGKNIYEVLSLPIYEALDFFKDIPNIYKKLDNLKQVGLDYLNLSQSMTTLSGGELQRLKLAFQLENTGQIYFLDEPTSGLHLQDTLKLLRLFNDLVNKGNTLVLIEHNLTVISQADWLIDMGPDAGKYGGRICYSGIPSDSIQNKGSRTGEALRVAMSYSDEYY